MTKETMNTDERIPEDLEEHWFWSGSFLRLRTKPGAVGLAISTAVYPPPQCFVLAREFNVHERKQDQPIQMELPL